MSQIVLTLPRPDDWHTHFRDNDYLERTVPDTAVQFGRVVAMPNLSPPVVSVARAQEYRQRLINACPENHRETFNPVMALYLTEDTCRQDVVEASECDQIIGFKLYPQGATTGSQSGIDSLEKLAPMLAILEEKKVPLLIHAEVTDSDIDVFDREAVFIDRWLTKWRRQFPALKMILEHVSTEVGVDFIYSDNSGNTAATITPQHLRCNRNDLLAHKLRPHLYCLPILKARSDQQAIVRAAVSGDSRFFLGTDSAPHAKEDKLCSEGCAGIYNVTSAMSIYTEIFDQHQALDKLKAFACHNGADFYGFKRSTTNEFAVVKQPLLVADSFNFGDSQVVPMAAGETLSYSVVPLYSVEESAESADSPGSAESTA